MSWKIVRSNFKAALGRQMAWPQKSLCGKNIQLVVYVLYLWEKSVGYVHTTVPLVNIPRQKQTEAQAKHELS